MMRSEIILIWPLRVYVYFIDVREEGRERERERNIHEERESRIGCLLHAPHWGLSPQPGHVPLTGNRTQDPSVRRPTLYPLSQTGLSRGRGEWGGSL